MKETATKPKIHSATGVGCLAFIVGAVVGFVALYIWSNSQVHTAGSGYALRGDHRAMQVIGDALFGAFVGGSVVSAIALVRRWLKKRRAEFREPSEEA